MWKDHKKNDITINYLFVEIFIYFKKKVWEHYIFILCVGWCMIGNFHPMFVWIGGKEIP
jgi:hypothetical protein